MSRSLPKISCGPTSEPAQSSLKAVLFGSFALLVPANADAANADAIAKTIVGESALRNSEAIVEVPLKGDGSFLA